MKNILVLCTGNSCRSQMAHGYLNQFAANQATIYSAGIETHGINPGAAAIMKEDGIDISQHTSNHVDGGNNLPNNMLIDEKVLAETFSSLVLNCHYLTA